MTICAWVATISNQHQFPVSSLDLTHWGRVTHICVSKLTIIGSDNGLSPDRRQAIVWTNAGLLLIGPLGTNFNEILIEILTFPFKKMRLKVSSAKRRPFCLGLNVLTYSTSCCITCQMDTNKSHPHFQNRWKIEWFIACWLELVPSDCIISLALILKKNHLSQPWKLVFSKSYHS